MGTRQAMAVSIAIMLGICAALMLASCSPVPRQEQTGGEERFAIEPTDVPADTGSWQMSLGFAGDVCFADNYVPMQHLAEIGSTELSDGIDGRFLSLMRGMDLMWVNNEFVYSDRGEALDGKAWTFRAKTANVSYLLETGADIAGLANNHVYDYGEDAFFDTLDTLAGSGIPYVGAGHDAAEAYAPVVLESHGISVAYVAASCAENTIYTPEAGDGSPGIAWCYDDAKFIESIREADRIADFVVALPHWGTEHSTDLTSKQRESARAYIDAGADAVVGAHAHNLQGIEYHMGKPILYNLGNFWFDEYDVDTMLAEIRLSGDNGMEGVALSAEEMHVDVVLHPGVQSGVFTRFSDTPEERDRIFRELEAMSPAPISIGIDGSVSDAAQTS